MKFFGERQSKTLGYSRAELNEFSYGSLRMFINIEETLEARYSRSTALHLMGGAAALALSATGGGLFLAFTGVYCMWEGWRANQLAEEHRNEANKFRREQGYREGFAAAIPGSKPA